MKIVFWGTPDFSNPFLEKLINQPDFSVEAVVCQPDKPVGRKKVLTAPAVKILALDNQIKVLQPNKLKNKDFIKTLKEIKADFFVVVAYGKIIPEEILTLPNHGCVNVHPSLLPKYRGPSPIQSSLANGDTETGISIMLLDTGMDTGPILASETILLDDIETYTTLVKKIHTEGPGLLARTLKHFNQDKIKPLPQKSEGVSLSKILTREDGHITWQEKMSVIDQKSRAYEIWPGLWTNWNNQNKINRLKLISLKPSDFNHNLSAGTVLIKNNRLFIDCLNGTLEILRLQLEGKKEISISDFINGHQEINGAKLFSLVKTVASFKILTVFFFFIST